MWNIGNQYMSVALFMGMDSWVNWELKDVDIAYV